MKLKMVLMGAVIMVTGSLAGAQGFCNAQADSPCVDWEQGVAYASGMGAPASWAKNPAQKNISATTAAKVDAQRNLLQLVKGVNLSSSTTLEGQMASNDSVRSTVEGRLAGVAPVGNPHYFSDGSVQVKMMARLRDVIPPDIIVSSEPPRNWSQPAAPAPVAPGNVAVNTDTSYSGLVVDATGTNVTPALSPRLLDPNGEVVYSAEFVTRDFALSQGIVGYAKAVERAKTNDRVKGNPLVVKAQKSAGSTQSDIVLTQSDADALRRIAQNQKFLRECRVMVVVD